jgi:hypothetical protein
MNINEKIVITVCFTAICVYLTILAQNYVSAKSKDVYHILVDVETSKLYLFKNDVLEKEYKCAGGKQSTPSPIGTWTINSKGKWGEGFGGSWMRN